MCFIPEQKSINGGNLLISEIAEYVSSVKQGYEHRHPKWQISNISDGQ